MPFVFVKAEEDLVNNLSWDASPLRSGWEHWGQEKLFLLHLQQTLFEPVSRAIRYSTGFYSNQLEFEAGFFGPRMTGTAANRSAEELADMEQNAIPVEDGKLYPVSIRVLASEGENWNGKVNYDHPQRGSQLVSRQRLAQYYIGDFVLPVFQQKGWKIDFDVVVWTHEGSYGTSDQALARQMAAMLK